MSNDITNYPLSYPTNQPRTASGDRKRAAFAGYAALNDPNELKWWEVLLVDKNADNETIRQKFLHLARVYHPDNGGDPVIFDQVKKAYDLAMGKK